MTNEQKPPMRVLDKLPQVKRRGFLTGAAGMSVIPIVPMAAAGLPGSAAAAVSFKVLGVKVGATLVRMARDIYPHDRIADRYYIQALMAHEKASTTNRALKKLILDGVAQLNVQAKTRFGSEYLAIAKESDRVSLLKDIEASEFFQKIRGDLVTGLYDNKKVWPILGYEGSSWEKGGYIHRGFNDINWI